MRYNKIDILESPMREFQGGGGSIADNFKKPKNISADAFGKRLIDICQKCKEKESSLAFAFLLYDEGSPHISKILSDEAYWDALDYHSGNLLTVFALNRQSAAQSTGRKSKSTNRITGLNKIKLTSEWPISLGSKNELARKYLNVQEIVYPALVFFQINSMKVEETLVVELKSDKIEDGFLEIKKYLNTAAKSLKLIDEPYKGNYCEIFQNLVENVEAEIFVRKVERRGKIWVDVISFFSSLPGLF